MRASLRSQVCISAERCVCATCGQQQPETCEERAQVTLVASNGLCATVKCADCVKSKARKPSGFEDWPEGFRYLCGR